MGAVAFVVFSLFLGVVASFEGDLTWYDPSVGFTACGTLHSPAEFIAALSFADFIDTPNPNNSPSCQLCALISGPSGATVKVQIKDKCARCASGDIDVSPAAFQVIAPLEVGRLRVSWDYVPCDRQAGVPSPESVRSTGVPPPESVPSTGASLIGYYAWTWSTTPGLPDATMSVAFSGWTNVDNALADSANVYASLKGSKYISFGGGNANGAFSQSGLAGIDAAISGGRLSDYSGIVYDVEEGDSGLTDAFLASFALAKANGFTVFVTVSHSAPYGISDAAVLMDSFLSSANIDYISPQLYTSGTESSNDYAITSSSGYGWEHYANSQPAVVVSIVRASMYADAVSYFQGIGVSLAGYVQWEQ